MAYLLAFDNGMVDWANAVLAVLGLTIAIVALWQTRRSNAVAKEANEISRASNNFAPGANALSAQAVQMQLDQSLVRLVVKPQMLHVLGAGEDRRARPFVTVINLSALPVTIEKIWWKKADPQGHKGFYWKSPTVTDPLGSLPARLQSHQALTAIGMPDCFESVDDLLSITAGYIPALRWGESTRGPPAPPPPVISPF